MGSPLIKRRALLPSIFASSSPTKGRIEGNFEQEIDRKQKLPTPERKAYSEVACSFEIASLQQV